MGGAGPGLGGPPEPERGSRTRRWLAAAGFLIALGAFALLQLKARSAREEASVPAFAARPAVGMPEEPRRDVEPAESGLYSAEAERAASGPMSLDEFIAGLEREAPPVHKALTEAFEKDPPMRRALDGFRKERSGKAPAGEFMRALRPMPEFRQLLARFRGEPGFQGAFLKVMQHPELGRAMLGQVSAVKPSPGARPHSGVGSFRPVKAYAGAQHDPGVLQRWAAMGSSGGGPGSPGGQSAQRFEANDRRELASAGPEAHAITPLGGMKKDKIEISKSEDQIRFEEILSIYPCLASLGRETVLRLIKSADIFQYGGVWGACFHARMYDTCLQSGCSKPLDKPGMSGCWQACLDANGSGASDLECIQQVRNQPGCGPADVPAQTRDRFCVQRCSAPDPKTGKRTLLNPPVPHPQCGGAPLASVCAGDTGPITDPCAKDPNSPRCLCPSGSCSGFSVRSCEETSISPSKFEWYNDGSCYSQGGICCRDELRAKHRPCTKGQTGGNDPDGACACPADGIKYRKGGAVPPVGPFCP